MLFRVGIAGLLAWVIVIVLASIAPIWKLAGVRTTTSVVPVLIAVGFAALFAGLLALLAACVSSAVVLVRRRLQRPTT